MYTTEESLSYDTDEYIGFDELACRFYEMEPRQRVEVEFGAATHAGKVRENNEDNYIVVRRRRERDLLMTSLPVELLPQTAQVAYTLAIADGMGGHAFGDLASYLALRTGWDLGEGEVKWAVKVNEHEALVQQPDAGHPDHAVMRELRELLAGETDAAGRPFDIVDLPAPAALRDDEGFVDWSYVNHLVVDGGVVACGFGEEEADARARSILAEVYPGRKVVTVDARELFARGGGIHCITQQQPRIQDPA